MHESLMKKYNWYRDWHQKPNANSEHWIIFFLISISVSVIFVINILSDQNISNIPNAALVITSDMENIDTVNNQLRNEVRNFEVSTSTKRKQSSDKLKNILEKRQRKMLSKMQNGDKDLNSYFLSDEESKKLPSELQSYVEKKISTNGEMSALYVDTLIEKDSKINYELNVNGSTSSTKYNVYFEKGKNPLISGKVRASIKGRAISNNIFIAAADGATSTVTATPTVTATASTASVSGVKKLLVILINFKDNPAVPYPKSTVYNSVFTNTDSTNALIKEGSNNLVSLAGDVTDWLTIDATSTTACEYWTWGSKADQAAQLAGYTTSNYNYIMYYINGSASCNWGGMGYVGGNRSYINGVYAAHGSKAHELGHNFGAWHSGFLDCGTQQISTSCSFDGYGEYVAKMGGANNYQFNALNRSQFGWIPPSQVKTITTSGTYTISSDYSTSITNPQIIKIGKRNASNLFYYITFKQASGFNRSTPAGDTKGITVYEWDGSFFTKMLTMTPGGGYTNAALWDGGVFNDTINNIKITQLSHTVDSATITIDFGDLVKTTCTPAKPIASLTPSTQTTESGKSAIYKLSVTNKNSFECASASYSITPSLPSGFTASTTSINLNSGSTTAIDMLVLSTKGIVNGSYPVSVNIAEKSGSSVSASASATYVISNPVVSVPVDTTDYIAPKLSVKSPGTGYKIINNEISIIASATDNVGVTKMDFSIDNNIITTVSTSTLSLKYSTASLSSGTHMMAIRVFDQRGNIASFTALINTSTNTVI